MRKFRTANGIIESEENLREFYGDDFDRMLRNGDFVQVDSDIEEEVNKKNLTVSWLMKQVYQRKYM